MSDEPGPIARELLIDAGIERALLGAMLYDPTFAEPIFEVTAPNHFGFAKHQIVAQAIQLVSRDDEVNGPNVGRKLKQMGKLEESGGSKFLLELELETPAAVLSGAISWAEQTRELWQKRALLNEARMLVATLETNSVEDAFAAVENTAQRVELYRPSPAIAIGEWADEMCNPVEEPPPIEWLLRDDMCEGNHGAIPLGRAALLSAGGGTGKTTMLCQLAVAVALGLPWCGFKVQTPGCVALCCGESDKQLMQIHLWRAYNSFGLSDEARRDAAHNIYTKPLMGQVVNVIGNGTRNDFQRMPFLTQFRQELTKVSERSKAGFALVVMDPLSRFAGPDVEKDNSAATSYVAAVETLCALPGTPTVINAHHSSKTSGQNGKSDARGVTGIQDGFRSNTSLTAFQFETLRGILMSNVKNNMAPHFGDRWLIQQTEKGLGGTLRLATEPEAAALGEAMVSQRGGKRAKKYDHVPTERPNLHDAIVLKLRDIGGSAKSRDWLFNTHLSGFRKADVWYAFDHLIESNEITIDRTGSARGCVRLVIQNGQSALPFEAPKVVPESFPEQGGNDV